MLHEKTDLPNCRWYTPSKTPNVAASRRFIYGEKQNQNVVNKTERKSHQSEESSESMMVIAQSAEYVQFRRDLGCVKPNFPGAGAPS